MARRPGCCHLLLLQCQVCAEVPITHRRGLHLVPETELLGMSLQQYDDVLKKSKLSTDTHKVQMVRRPGNRIAKAAEAFLSDTGQQDKIKNYKWEFNLIKDDKTVNAWVMPGGKAAVYTGILPYTQDETGLAVVLGHEVAHALADHSIEKLHKIFVTPFDRQDILRLIVIALGTLAGGWRVIETLGMKMTKLKPVHGFCAETAAASSILLSTVGGIPVSTAHTITGAIIGVGATTKLSAIRWGVAYRIVWAWILTIPGTAVVAALIWYLLHLLPLPAR